MKRIVPMLVLAALVVAVAPASAQSDLGLKRVGAALAYVSPENVDGTVGLGVFADLGTIAPRITLESRLDYWSKSESAYGLSASVRDVVIGARGKYLFDVANPKIVPFAGAGLGLHFVHAEVVVPPLLGFDAMTSGDSSTKLGLDLGGGIATHLGPRSDLLTEAWYGIVSDVAQFSLRVGLSYRLGS